MRQKLTKDKEVLRKRLMHLIKTLNSRNYTSLNEALGDVKIGHWLTKILVQSGVVYKDSQGYYRGIVRLHDSRVDKCVELIKEHYKDVKASGNKPTDKQIPIVFSEPKIRVSNVKFCNPKPKIGLLKRFKILFTGEL
jgi:hypothetical protein